MKKSFLKLILLLLCVFIIFSISFTKAPSYTAENNYTSVINALEKTYAKEPETLRIMSYNLLADTPGFKGSPAYSRADGVCSILNTLKPDIVALQETSRNWFYSLNENTPYKFIAPVKTNFFGTMTAIIYNPEAVTLNQWGEYVFPETLNGRLRCAVWGLFTDKAHAKSFIVLNTHLSLRENGTDIPLKQATDIINLCTRLQEKYSCPLFLAGDFNSDKRFSWNYTSAPIYETLCTALTDTADLVNEKGNGQNKSFSSYRADHIFIKGDVTIERYIILSQGEFANLSDHYPIFVDFLL